MHQISAKDPVIPAVFRRPTPDVETHDIQTRSCIGCRIGLAACCDRPVNGDFYESETLHRRQIGYLTPSVIIKAMKASRDGFKHGKKEGKEMQLPAVFIVDGDGKIAYAYYGKNIGDVPDNRTILNAVQA